MDSVTWEPCDGLLRAQYFHYFKSWDKMIVVILIVWYPPFYSMCWSEQREPQCHKQTLAKLHHKMAKHQKRKQEPPQSHSLLPKRYACVVNYFLSAIIISPNQRNLCCKIDLRLIYWLQYTALYLQYYFLDSYESEKK